MSELFRFDLVTNTWTQLRGRNATGAPPDRINAMAAFEPSARQLLLFGGNQSASRADLRELWQFDIATSAWSMVPITVGPIARAKGAFFDGSPAYLFSGIASLLIPPASMVEDFHSFDADAGWKVESALGPAGRLSAASVARDGKLYVFAGGTTARAGRASSPSVEVRSRDAAVDAALRRLERGADRQAAGDDGRPLGATPRSEDVTSQAARDRRRDFLWPHEDQTHRHAIDRSPQAEERRFRKFELNG